MQNDVVGAKIHPMSQRTILITGAGRGLGLGLARSFADAGDSVIGTVRSRAAAVELGAVTDHIITLDVRSDDSIAECADEVMAHGSLDVLINNAGINVQALRSATDVGRGRGPLDLSREELMGVFDVNAFSPLLLTKALRPALRASRRALVVNVSSQLGSMAVGATAARDTGYNASKAALNMITANLAGALTPDGITVVCLHPGWVQTDMGGEQASLTIEEAAKAVAATINGLSPADTGQFFRWDGSPHPW